MTDGFLETEFGAGYVVGLCSTTVAGIFVLGLLTATGHIQAAAQWATEPHLSPLHVAAAVPAGALALIVGLVAIGLVQEIAMGEEVPEDA